MRRYTWIMVAAVALQCLLVCLAAYCFAMDEVSGRWQALLVLPIALVLSLISAGMMVAAAVLVRRGHLRLSVGLVAGVVFAATLSPFVTIGFAKGIAPAFTNTAQRADERNQQELQKAFEGRVESDYDALGRRLAQPSRVLDAKDGYLLLENGLVVKIA